MPMTIEQAADKWKVSVNAIMGYIQKGYINGITAERNMLFLPDIPKPHIVRNGYIKDKGKQYSHILKAYHYSEYIDQYLLGISKEEFEFMLTQLEGAGYLAVMKSTEPTDSFFRYHITVKGTKGMNSKNFRDLNLNFSPSINAGLVNANVNAGINL